MSDFVFILVCLLIIVVPAVIAYLIWFWVFGKMKSRKKRITYAGIATLVLTPILIGITLAVLEDCTDDYPQRDFTEEGWQKNNDKRYEYAESIVKSKMLIGKTKDEVAHILGAGGYMHNDSWFYDLGYTPGILHMGKAEMRVEFDNEVVVNVIYIPQTD